ncbi:MAG TPA: hypothetical protein VK508_17650 [Cyclobacteriaceae bacterium]|nr:hypothetical protein [Cyclobacteriaceae bacterium]
MKLTIVLIVAVYCNAFGQTGKGSWMIGGSASFQHWKSPAFNGTTGTAVTETSSSFSVSPNVGYFILRNWAVGLSTSFSGIKSEYTGSSGTSNSRELGIFTRYYFPVGKQFFLFSELSGRRGRIESNSTFTIGSSVLTSETEWNIGRYKAGIGLAWFVSTNVAIEGILSYTKEDRKISREPTDTQKVTAFNIGLQFFIRSKKSIDQSNE